MKYVALISCHNEEKNIEATARAILMQTIPPARFVIIDDYSTDKTAEVVSRIPGVVLVKKRYPRYPVRGVNLSLALNAGVDEATRLLPDWDYLLKVDADSILPNNYVEDLLKKFKEIRPGERSLGIASGNPQDERIWKGRASDGAKMFRRGCLEAIGGFPLCNAFDTLMILRAKYHGWGVESFEDIHYFQTRTMRRVKLSRWVLSGRSRYYLGFPVWHTFLIAIVYMKQKPYFLGGFSMFLAHLLTRIGCLKRPWSTDFYRFTSSYAMEELMDRIKSRQLK